MPVRVGPWQQKSKEGSKPLGWDAIGDFWTFPNVKDHMTNEEVRNRIQNAIGVHDDLLTMVKKGKQMVWQHLKILWHDEDNYAADSEREQEGSRRDGR